MTRRSELIIEVRAELADAIGLLEDLDKVNRRLTSGYKITARDLAKLDKAQAAAAQSSAAMLSGFDRLVKVLDSDRLGQASQNIQDVGQNARAAAGSFNRLGKTSTTAADGLDKVVASSQTMKQADLGKTLAASADGADELRRGLRRVERETRGAGNTAKKSKRDWVGLKDAVGTVNNALDGFLGLAALAAGGGGLVLGIGKTTSAISQMNRDLLMQSRAIGVNVEALSGLRFAVGAVGKDVDVADDILRTLSERIRDAATGSEDALEFFNDLGVGVVDLNGDLRNVNDVLHDVADALAAEENQTKKTAIATGLLGDEAAQAAVIFEQGAAGLKAMADRGRELGAVIDEDAAEATAKLADAQVELNAAWKGAGQQLTQVFAPGLAQGVELLVKWVGALTFGLEQMRRWIGGVAAMEERQKRSTEELQNLLNATADEIVLLRRRLDAHMDIVAVLGEERARESGLIEVGEALLQQLQVKLKQLDVYKDSLGIGTDQAQTLAAAEAQVAESIGRTIVRLKEEKEAAGLAAKAQADLTAELQRQQGVRDQLQILLAGRARAALNRDLGGMVSDAVDQVADGSRQMAEATVDQIDLMIARVEVRIAALQDLVAAGGDSEAFRQLQEQFGQLDFLTGLQGQLDEALIGIGESSNEIAQTYLQQATEITNATAAALGGVYDLVSLGSDESSKKAAKAIKTVQVGLQTFGAVATAIQTAQAAIAQANNAAQLQQAQQLAATHMTGAIGATISTQGTASASGVAQLAGAVAVGGALFAGMAALMKSAVADQGMDPGRQIAHALSKSHSVRFVQGREITFDERTSTMMPRFFAEQQAMNQAILQEVRGSGSGRGQIAVFTPDGEAMGRIAFQPDNVDRYLRPQIG